jgi:hypothetical protein
VLVEEDEEVLVEELLAEESEVVDAVLAGVAGVVVVDEDSELLLPRLSLR